MVHEIFKEARLLFLIKRNCSAVKIYFLIHRYIKCSFGSKSGFPTKKRETWFEKSLESWVAFDSLSLLLSYFSFLIHISLGFFRPLFYSQGQN